jgi:hypothetical protein
MATERPFYRQAGAKLEQHGDQFAGRAAERGDADVSVGHGRSVALAGGRRHVA